MCKFNPKNDGRFIDPCLRKKNIEGLSLMLSIVGLRVVASCCGHKKYPLTIVVKNLTSNNYIFELRSGVHIPRTRNFYKKDKQGVYYIPEVSK